MTILPHEEGEMNLGSVGPAIADGTLSIDAPTGDLNNSGPASGELVYTGKNVMMGYALQRDDLAKPDTQCERLETGDIGYLDENNYLYITGRSKRIAKVFGVRINLDEVETLARRFGRVAAVAGNESIVVFVESDDLPGNGQDEARVLAGLMNLNYRAFDVRRLDEIPTTGSGKTNYGALVELS